MRTWILLLLALLLGACEPNGRLQHARGGPPPAAPVETKPLRVYLIGNSLTYNAFQNPDTTGFMNERGHRAIFGMDICWGSSLARIWSQPTTGSAMLEPYGFYGKALTEYEWDVITLQPYSSQLDGEKGDISSAVRFIEFARRKSPDAQFYIYQDWPAKQKEDFDFSAMWMRKNTDGKSGWGLHSRDYCEQLVRGIGEALPDLKKPLRVIPAGDVLYELDQRMKAGKVPGFASAAELYLDNIHVNAAANYAVRCTFYATLYGEDARGLPAAPDGKVPVNDEMAAIFQDAVWKVVNEHPLAGVKR